MRRSGFFLVVLGIVVGLWVPIALVAGRTQRTSTAEGTVLDSTARDGKYYPAVSFKPAGSDEIIHFISQSPVGYQSGQKVPVAYEPANPVNAAIETSTTIALIWTCRVGGILIVLLGLWRLLGVRAPSPAG